ncbi:Serine/threonine-protein kinase hal4 [Schizosaccharomyces pombe]|uniref:Serine/threonine-protein kinase hal4 n=1 Tax=Schizosaccharomyces pombe (strain 972 / ATCC 24843) TaxID=284812 RepID=HAL4_SCHPO|nr:halotolerence protein 4 [Schizosaccharomyces pombe]O14019.1 RecName: Full=Serine/threonine-protein kinase hal4; AltName: Full=Halotolerance protein 4; AltName: Full=Serine/threonine-protein kinase ppk10 [Schizosaccharomyces pombe 972h-]CAB10142.1 halotolerence protein 4 [Schizosaccharomyces pombe]|eukprot:NP_594866.1 halotolerence protein 4 [Schizosaccharomyces pombe]
MGEKDKLHEISSKFASLGLGSLKSTPKARETTEPPPPSSQQPPSTPNGKEAASPSALKQNVRPSLNSVQQTPASIDAVASSSNVSLQSQQPLSKPVVSSKPNQTTAMPPPSNNPSRHVSSTSNKPAAVSPNPAAHHAELPSGSVPPSASVSRANSTATTTPHKAGVVSNPAAANVHVLSVAASPNPSTPSNGPAPVSTTATPSRNPVTRLQRIFSQNSVSRQNSRTGRGAAVANTEETNSTGGSETGGAANSSSTSNPSSAKWSRFTVYDDASHTHQLRPARRQEKLGKMLKDFLAGNSKKREEERIAKEAADAQHQLSLVQSWINGYGQEKLADKKDPAKVSASFVEKYGRCQEVIGRGAFGVVRIAHKVDPQNSGSETLYAVKEFRRKPAESQKKYTKRLTSEFCISSSLRHPNVIHTLDLIQDGKGDYCEVMELCSGGDLYTLIMAAGRLEPMEADCFFKQLMRGVDYLHDMGVAHRDLKPENLLLTVSGSLKITDFGNGECFRMAWEKEAHMTCGLCGSAPYIAPEEYTESEFDPRAVDVWACGVIYMAMRTGRHLWRVAKKSEDEYYSRYLMDRKNESGYEPIEMLERSRCRNTLYNILHPNPTYRLTAKQIMKSEWVRSITLCEAGNAGL